MSVPFDDPFPNGLLIPMWARPPVWLPAAGYIPVAYRAPRSREIFWDFLGNQVWQASPIQGLRRNHKRVILVFRPPTGPAACPGCGEEYILKKEPGHANVLQFRHPGHRPAPGTIVGPPEPGPK